jgi:hypothetical protein
MGEIDESDVAAGEETEEDDEDGIIGQDGVCKGKKVSAEIEYPHEDADVLRFFGTDGLDDLRGISDKQKDVADVADDG